MRKNDDWGPIDWIVRACSLNTNLWAHVNLQRLHIIATLGYEVFQI